MSGSASAQATRFVSSWTYGWWATDLLHLSIQDCSTVLETGVLRLATKWTELVLLWFEALFSEEIYQK